MCSRSTVYVYSGYGCKKESMGMLTSALNKHVDPSHHDIVEISPSDIIKGDWRKDAGVMVIGGGFDLGFIKSLGPEGMQCVRDFVWVDGGAYLGICAGAYFACDRIEFDKGGPLEVCGDRQLKFYPGACIGPVYPGFSYDSEEGAVAAPVDVSSYRPWADILGPVSQVFMYVNGGGCFTPPRQDMSSVPTNGKVSENLSDNCNASNGGISNEFNGSNGVEGISNGDGNERKKGDVTTEVLGRFAGLPDCPPALIKCCVGSSGGKAVLSCVHFEYDPGMMVVGQKSLKESVVKDLSKSDRERKLILNAILKEVGVKTI